MLGQLLGHYRVIDKLGEGGMGVVYRAHDDRLDRDVALKVLPPGTLRDEGARRRFRKEALTLSKLNHPNIATIFDFDTEDGTDFLVMEYVPGATLSDSLTAGPLAQDEVARLGAQMAEGLAAAHQQGVIHRDLKPSNLRTTADGRLKILDFGLARLTEPSTKAITESLSDAYSGAGTLPYMAPEQLRGETGDHRTDIYSSGVVLYEMSTGRRPFDGKLPTLVTDAILHQTPRPPSSLNRRLSAGLESIILKALEKRPERRYQSAKELLVDLQRLSAPGAPTVERQWRRRRRTLAVAVAAAFFVLLPAFALIPSGRAAVLRWLGWGGAVESRVLTVLPFEAIGGEDHAALSRGLTETLTAALGKVSQSYGLEVVPASEVRAYSVTTVEQARKTFGVDLVLAGSLQVAQQARVTFSLMDAGTRRQLASNVVDADASNLFALEDRVIENVLAALEIELRPGEPRRLLTRGTTQSAAYEYYLRGQGYLQNCQQERAPELAIPLFQRALEEDGGYALAYAGLGQAYWCRYEQTKDTVWVERALEACQKAQTLGDQFAPVHLALGRVLRGTGSYERAAREYDRALEIDPTSDDALRGLAASFEALAQPGNAERTYQRALALRPDFAGGYGAFGAFFARQGRYEEAAKMFHRTIELAPENVRSYNSLGAVLSLQGQWEQARALFEKSLNVQPNYVAYSNLGHLFFFREARYADAAAMFEKAVELDKRDYRVWQNLASAYYWAPGGREKSIAAYRHAAEMLKSQLEVNPQDADLVIRLADCYGMLGEATRARTLIRRALDLAPDNVDVMFRAGDIYEHLGDRERALEWIGKALDRGYSLEEVERSPGLKLLRSDPRFPRPAQRTPSP
ncbi:MAG: protein kinase domain-containing protein [Candidatus Acidiferrales bacterium]